MPGRSWGGGSSSSSSSRSSSRSSSSSSSGRSSWRRPYNGSDDGEPADPMWGYISLGILGVIVLFWIIGSVSQNINEKNESANATATTHAVTLADLTMMHGALDSQLPRWRELGSTTPTHVGAEAAGFADNTNTREVVYGYCDDAKTQFYVYVLNESRPKFTYSSDTEGYAYLTNQNPASCHPPEWTINDYVRVEEEAGWYFAIMRTKLAPYATSLPRSATPKPPAF
jgi:hypothetical protein